MAKVKKEVIIESWKSNRGNREDHYFVRDGKVHYVFGYNPKFVTKEQIAKIRKILKV